MVAFRNPLENKCDRLVEYECIKNDTSAIVDWFKGMKRTDSQATIIPANSNDLLAVFPPEIIIMIAMHSGFFGALSLGQTCRKYRLLLQDKKSWSEYEIRSDDVLEIKVDIDTRLHQFDQIIFCTWPDTDPQTPCIVHRTFTGDYKFLGGISFPSNKREITPSFFEERDSLPCVAAGSIDHICKECEKYNLQTVQKSTFVHAANAIGAIKHTFEVNPRLRLNIDIRPSSAMLGYDNEDIFLTKKMYKLNGVQFNPKLHGLYNHFTKTT